MSTASAVVPVGYKQTEVGVIPEDWNVETLNQFVNSHQAGIFKDKSEYGTGTNIIGVADIYDIESIDGQEFNRVNLSASEIRQYCLKKGDLLYNESSLVKEGIARTVYVSEKGEGTAFAWHTRKFSIEQKKVHSPYLYFYLQSKPARKFIESVCIQTALTGINTVQYFQCPLILPSLLEQRIIAEKITIFSNLIQSFEMLVDKKRDIKQGTMQELLTGKTRLPGFTENWSSLELNELIKKFVNGGTPSTKNLDYWSGTIPWITGADILHQKVAEIRRYITNEAVNHSSTNIIDKDELLVVTRTGVGKLAISPFPIAISQDFTGVLLRKESCNVAFLFYNLDYNSSVLRSMNQGTSIAGITRESLASMRIEIPEIDEQEAIAEVLSDMDAEITALEERLEKAKAIKQGMMQQLLTGKIRLVEPQTSQEVSA